MCIKRDEWRRHCVRCVRACARIAWSSAKKRSPSKIIFRVTLYRVYMVLLGDVFYGYGNCVFLQTLKLIAFANGLTGIQFKNSFVCVFYGIANKVKLRYT